MKTAQRGIGHLFAEQNRGLGYTWAEEQACSKEVEIGRGHRARGNDYKQRGDTVVKDMDGFKKGADQLALDNLMKDYAEMSARKVELEAKLIQSRKITQAWTANPEINYQAYLEMGSPAGLGFLKKFFNTVKRGVAQVSTFGQACNGAVKEMEEDAKFEVDQKAYYEGKLQTFNTYKAQVKANTEVQKSALEKLKLEINSLVEALQAEDVARRQIMQNYEVQKRQEEMRLADEAREREREKEAQNNATDKKSNTTTYLLIGGALVAGYLLTRKKKTTVIKAKKVKI